MFEEENEDAGSDEYQEPNDNDGSSEDEAQAAITAGNGKKIIIIIFFPAGSEEGNILTQQPRIIAAPEREVDAFKIFYRPEIIFHIVLETNRKARDVRHECKLSPNSVYKSFSSQEVESRFCYYDWC